MTFFIKLRWEKTIIFLQMHNTALHSKAILQSRHQLQDAAEVGLATQELVDTCVLTYKNVIISYATHQKPDDEK